MAANTFASWKNLNIHVMNQAWANPPVSMKLAKDEIHVWRVDLNLAMVSIQKLTHSLSPDELARAERYKFTKDQVRFIATRGVLRTILSRYTGISPGQIRFRYGSHGKPSLDMHQNDNAQSLHFNLSHSNDLALIALARTSNIGVDVESLRSNIAFERLARRHFTASEQNYLFNLSPDLKLYAFYAIWTRKEAYLKAIGSGLSKPLDEIEVDVSFGQEASTIYRITPHDCTEAWSTLEIVLGPGHSAALAVAGKNWKLSNWQWA